MTTIYKFEILVPDYEKKGIRELTRSLFDELYVSTVERKDVEFFDNRDTQQIDKLFSGWLPITTAPRDGSRFLLWYAKEKRQYVVYFEEFYEDCVTDTYFVVDSPVNHTDRYIIEEKNLVGSYWQPLQTPPQL